MAAKPQRGIPVSAEDLKELADLRKLFGGEETLKKLESFAVWLFAGAGTLGALAAAGKAVGLGDLTDEGLKWFGVAVVLFGIALVFATLARLPVPARFNRYSSLSMRAQLNRILWTRFWLLAIAAGFFAAALVAAASAPLQQARTRTGGPASLVYDLEENGKLSATLNVRGAKRFSPATLTVLARPQSRTNSLPRSRGLSDGSGRATLNVAVTKTQAMRTALLRGSWLTPDGGTKTLTWRLPLRSALAPRPRRP